MSKSELKNARPLSTLNIVAGCLGWFAVIAFGFHNLLSFESTPGAIKPAMNASLPESLLKKSNAPYTLLMFVHPQCPCSNASISELAILMAHCPRMKSYVLFVRPRGFAPDWEKSNLWSRAVNIPGVEAVADLDGKESARFMATTSGETALFDQSGKLVFAGGITAGRGHEGDNAGRRAIQDIYDGNPLSAGLTPVFGCPLANNPTQNIEAR